LSLVVAEGVPELSARAVSPSIHGPRAGEATGTQSAFSWVARASLTFLAWGPFIQRMVSIMVAGAPEASRMARNRGRAVRSATEGISSLLSCREEDEPCLLWLRETLM
jgi:hypothetical protein